MPISIKQKNYIHSSPQTNKQDLNLKATELRLGLPGSESPERSINGGMKSLVAGAKRGFSDTINIGSSSFSPKFRTEVVGWPPIRSFRKNLMTQKNTKNEDDPNAESRSCVYVKVSMDGAPYLRKVDLKMYSSYLDLSSALETMFSSFTLGQCESPLMNLSNGSEYVLTYEDKDGDLMLVGDVPWDMFTCSCKRMRIMKSSDTIGLAPRAVEECKSQN